MTAFAEALALTLRFEGGYVNDPADRGGATNFGVTQRVYDHYRNGLGIPPRDVKGITPVEVQSIYEYSYWLPARCDVLVADGKPKLATVHFDTAVNSGVGRAVKFLQRALELDADGIWGPDTARAAAQCNEAEVVPVYLDIRTNFYHDIVNADATQGKFLTGWLKRVEQLRAAVA